MNIPYFLPIDPPYRSGPISIGAEAAHLDSVLEKPHAVLRTAA
jgi:hypothetical protein